MVAIPQSVDPTLALADAQMVLDQERGHRSHLGMSQIGRFCERETWYSFRWAAENNFDALTLKRFEDGHRTEDLVVARLQAAPGIELHSVDADGKQFRFSDFGGHFSGSCDGAILGLIQAPKTWHIYEGKCSEKWKEVDKAKKKVGEKNALAEWNPVYYAQAVLYMHYAELDRHYLVCSSPGGRHDASVRTDADPVHAQVMRDKAERIIFSDTAPDRIGGPSYYECKWCDVYDLCHSGAKAERNCRTCLHVTPMRDGTWHCGTKDISLSTSQQRKGCEQHLYLPTLIDGDQVDFTDDVVVYRMRDGSEWTDCGPEVKS